MDNDDDEISGRKKEMNNFCGSDQPGPLEHLVKVHTLVFPLVISRIPDSLGPCFEFSALLTPH